MTEFLKNNPIALRHCILYEFLRKYSVKESFNDFCETVGDDAIKKEEFQFWFNRFKQGIFHDENDNGSFTDMRDVFRSDKYALRAAVLYETLKSKNDQFGSEWQNRCVSLAGFSANHPFFVYENFCEVIGEDMMEFSEFEFWFYRFLNGEFDLNFERDENQMIYELLDMPLDVMEIIVKQLDFYDRLPLSRTCQSLRLFIQDQKVFLDTLALEIHMASVTITCGFEYTEYTKSDNGCVKKEGKFKKKETFIQGVPYWKQALMDFKNTLKNPKLHFDTFYVIFDSNRNNDNEKLEVEVIDELETALKSTHQLKAKRLVIRARSVEPLLKILPYLKPGYLVTIESSLDDPSDVMMERLIEMKQWKQAKDLGASNLCFVGSLRHLFHFKKFDVRYEKITVEDVREIKEILPKSSDFEKCWLFFKNPIDTSVIKQEFGDAVRGNTCHYPTPNTKEYFKIKVVDIDRHILQISRKKA